MELNITVFVNHPLKKPSIQENFWSLPEFDNQDWLARKESRLQIVSC